MASEMAAKGHVNSFNYLNKFFIHKQQSVKVSQKLVEWLWRYAVLNPYSLNIKESLKHAWHQGIVF